MSESKRKPLIEVTEKNYSLAEVVRRKIAVHKAEHGLSTMLEALADMIGIHRNNNRKD